MRIGIDIGSTTINCVVLDDQNNIIYKNYERHFAMITEKTKVKMTSEDGTIDIREYPYEDLGPGAKERAAQRAAQAATAAAEEPAPEGFTPLAQTGLPRQNRDRRQPRRTEQPAQAKGNDKQSKSEQKPQNKADKPQQKGDKSQPKGDRKENGNRGSGKPRNDRPRGDKSSKAEAPAPKVDPVPANVVPVNVASVAAPEGGTAAVPFSRKGRSNRRRSFGPKKG